MFINFSRIFKKENNIVIGMVHFPPLLGYKNFPGLKVCLKKSLNDAKTLEKGGVDGIIVENNYDFPHKIFVGSETITCMTYLTEEIVKSVSVPVGINVLWNDYKASLSIAKVVGAKFVRVPVFVDSVQTQYGKILAQPKEVISFRKKIGASDVLLFTDIQVKHAKPLERKSISQSAKEAIKSGSDALIITGKWTGDAPDISEVTQARKAVGKKFPILIGSGATKENVTFLLQYANGVIVGTSLKTGQIRSKREEVNLKPWHERISLKKAREFVEIVHRIGR